jgi:hypothetical protein
MSSSSPARRTKIKISGSTQTGNQYSAGNSSQEYYSPSPQRSAMAAAGNTRQLSETTKERLLASHQRSPQTSTVYTKSRTRRLSRERPALPQMISLNSEYFSDSSDSMYGEVQKQINMEQQQTGEWYHHQHNAGQNQELSSNEGEK